MRNLLTRAFLIIFSSSLFFLLPASSGVGDSDFLGDLKSLLPAKYKHSLDDFEEDEHPSVMEDYRHALLPDSTGPSVPRIPDLKGASRRTPSIPRYEDLDQGESPLLSSREDEEEIPSEGDLSEEQALDSLSEGSLLSSEISPFVSEETDREELGVFLEGTSLEIPSSVLEEAHKQKTLEVLPESFVSSLEIPASVEESQKKKTLVALSSLDAPPMVEVDSPEGALEVLEANVKIKHPWLNLDMMSAGIEGGMVSSVYPYTSSVGAGSHGSYGSRQGSLGLRLTVEKLINEQWKAGMTGSFRYTLGDVDTKHGAVNGFSQLFNSKNTQRYELATKFGRTMGSLHPYMKVGAVSSLFLLNYSDSTVISSPKSKFLWGAMVGAGMDLDISEGVLLGGMMEYDYYNTYRGNLFNSAGNRDTYKVSPRLVNLMLSLTWKLDRLQRKT